MQWSKNMYVLKMQFKYHQHKYNISLEETTCRLDYTPIKDYLSVMFDTDHILKVKVWGAFRVESLEQPSKGQSESFFFLYKPVLEHQTWDWAHVIDTSVDRRLWDINWIPETYIITACFRSFLCKFRRYRLYARKTSLVKVNSRPNGNKVQRPYPPPSPHLHLYPSTRTSLYPLHHPDLGAGHMESIRLPEKIVFDTGDISLFFFNIYFNFPFGGMN